MALTAVHKKKLLAIPGMRALKKEYEKQQKKLKGKGRGMKGKGFWDQFASKIGSGAKNVDAFLKKTKVISKTGKIASILLPLALTNPATAPLAVGAPVALAVSKSAEVLGYGKRKRRQVKLPKPMLTMDGRFSTSKLPSHPATVIKGHGHMKGHGHVKGHGRAIRQGVMGTISSEFGKMKF